MSTIGGAGNGPGAASSLSGPARTPSTDPNQAAQSDSDRLFAALVASGSDSAASAGEPQAVPTPSTGGLVSLLAPQVQQTLFQAQTDHVSAADAIAPSSDESDPQVDALLKQYFGISNEAAWHASSSRDFGQTVPQQQAE